MYFIFGFSSLIIRWVSEEETRMQRDDSKRPGISMNNHLFPSSFTLTPSLMENLHGNGFNTQSAGGGSCLCPVCLHCIWETASLLESAAPTDECKVISAGCGCFVSILLPPTFDLRRLMCSALVKLKLTNFGCCCVWVLTAWTFIRLILCICVCVW